jgi:stage II sporulation protein D
VTGLVVLLGLALAAQAGAAARFYIRGAGYGHGIGMSQYGAYGYAQHGKTYEWILAHYYSGTSLGTVSSRRRVRVLLQQASRITFSGATSVGGRLVDPHRTYSAAISGTGISVSGVGRFTGSAAVHGTIRLGGTAINGVRSGTYRGALDLIARIGTIRVDNVLAIDDYVRGVVAGEMPSSWDPEALKAQAVAARTYALTAGGTGELYPDTRSQVYDGVSGETPRSNAAVSATRGQVVTYLGAPVVTYFFSTSGGRTENIEDSWPGSTPEPWLRSVEDPYDTISSLHRWGPYGMSMESAAAKLHGYVKGSFRGVQVMQRGGSPRVVWAYVLGTGGRTRIGGGVLAYRFGLYDSWMYFTVSWSGARPPSNFGEPAGSAAAGTSSSTPPVAVTPVVAGGAAPGGSVLPPAPGDTSGGAGAP